MILAALIVIVWLVIVGFLVALCKAAARGDRQQVITSQGRILDVQKRALDRDERLGVENVKRTREGLDNAD